MDYDAICSHESAREFKGSLEEDIIKSEACFVMSELEIMPEKLPNAAVPSEKHFELKQATAEQKIVFRHWCEFGQADWHLARVDELKRCVRAFPERKHEIQQLVLIPGRDLREIDEREPIDCPRAKVHSGFQHRMLPNGLGKIFANRNQRSQEFNKKTSNLKNARK
jgi:hypothetical protein